MRSNIVIHLSNDNLYSAVYRKVSTGKFRPKTVYCEFKRRKKNKHEIYCYDRLRYMYVLFKTVCNNARVVKSFGSRKKRTDNIWSADSVTPRIDAYWYVGALNVRRPKSVHDLITVRIFFFFCQSRGTMENYVSDVYGQRVYDRKTNR